MKKKKVFFAAAGLLLTGVFGMGLNLSQAEAKQYTENDIVYSITNGQATVTKCVSKEKKVAIPSEVNGYVVSKIGNSAFSRSKYQEISIPESVTVIENWAFSDCDSLLSMTLPDHLESLGNYAFYGCAKLKTVNLSQNLTKIPSYAFYQCISLKTVTLPDELEKIEDGAFEKCYKLSGVTLGEDLTEIGDRAFKKNYKLVSVKIPSGVKSVGRQAFYDCRGLKRAVFQGADTSVSDGLFQKCTALTKVVLPKKIKTIPEKFFAESGLKSFKLPGKVTIVKAGAFQKCMSLKKIVLNRKAYALGDRAFAYSALKEIKFNKNMQYIGNRAFLATRVKDITLPEKVMYIGNRIFADCSSLNKIKIPAGVQGINPRAFNNCTSLSTISVAPANPYYSSADGVLYNKAKTTLIQYPLNKKSTSFQVPGSVTTIRARAFEKNHYLKTVTLKTANIGRCAFAEMARLNTVRMLRGVQVIGEYAFENDAALKTVTMPDTVHTIGTRAFSKTGVTSMPVSRALKNLGSQAFYRCNKLISFTGGRGKYYKVRDGVLYNGRQTKLLLYPSKKKDKEFTVPKGVKSLGEQAFYRASNLRKLYFMETIKDLPYSCIDSCGRLRSVVFSGKTHLNSGYSAISSCRNLAVIVGTTDYVFRSMASNAGATLITL